MLYVIVREDLHTNTKSVVTSGDIYATADTKCQRYSEAAERDALPYVYRVEAKVARQASRR